MKHAFWITAINVAGQTNPKITLSLDPPPDKNGCYRPFYYSYSEKVCVLNITIQTPKNSKCTVDDKDGHPDISCVSEPDKKQSAPPVTKYPRD
jgi:hypothetical protein